MKIGILTFHDAINYGAIMQAQALYSTINSFSNAECYIIDYRCKAVDDMYKVQNIKSIKSLLKIPYKCMKRESFRRFLRGNCIHTRPIYRRNIKEIEDMFDVIVVGSDQVWNGNITGHDTTYLLDFCKDSVRKASYAASMGSYIIPEKEKNMYNKLYTFEGLSVREPRASKEIKELIGKEATVHLDPTLLQNSSYWLNYVKEPKVKQKYIFIYASGNVKSIVEAAKYIREQSGYKIYYMGNYSIDGGRRLSYVTPQEWLGWIYNAEIVFTNSFHGTAFSIIFRKKFYVDLNKNPNNKSEKGNERIENIISMFNLNKQIVENALSSYLNEPSWKDTEIQLLKQQKEALNYLRFVCEER